MATLGLEQRGRVRPHEVWHDGATPESNRASRGLHDLTGFEDRHGESCKPAWILGFSCLKIGCATVFATVRADTAIGSPARVGDREVGLTSADMFRSWPP